MAFFPSRFWEHTSLIGVAHPHLLPQEGTLVACGVFFFFLLYIRFLVCCIVALLVFIWKFKKFQIHASTLAANEVLVLKLV